MILFFIFIIAVFVTMVLIPPLMRSAEKLQFVDLPDARKVHTGAIPRIGGVAMVAGALLPMIMWLPPLRGVIGFLVGVGIILIFGVWDDRKNLDYRMKFLGQIIAVLVVVLYGEVRIDVIPFFGAEVAPVYLSIPLTIFALLGITNAINLADGLDGLAGGTTLLSLSVIALLAYMVDGTVAVMISLAVMGCILGFLRFNTYPARIFMGDGGSQFLGFSVGVLAIMLTQKVNTALSPALPVMILGLPILDTLMVMGQRIYEGRSPFAPDKNHIHHKLLALGFDHYEAVFLIYVVQAFLVMGAYSLRYQSDALILSVYVIFCLSVMVFFRRMANSGWSAHARKNKVSFLSRRMKWLRDEGRLSKWAIMVAAITIPVYFFLVASFASEVLIDLAMLSTGLLAVLVLLFPKRHGKPLNMVERACVYVACTLVIYLVQTAPGEMAEFKLYRDIFFVLLAIVVMIGFRFSRDKKFQATPLDFLIIFIAFTVPNLPEAQFSGAHIGEGIAKIIVMFYGVELVLSNIGNRWDFARYAMVVTLGILGLRGLWG